MQITTALLCDFAQVRQNLLFVCSGGITQLNRSSWPAKMGLHLALVIAVHPTEFGRPHELNVFVQSEDGARVAEATGGIQVDTAEETTPTEHATVPITLNLQDVRLQDPGRYATEILIGGHHQMSLPFRALSQDPQ